MALDGIGSDIARACFGYLPGGSCSPNDNVRKCMCIYEELLKLFNIPYSICICLDCTPLSYLIWALTLSELGFFLFYFCKSSTCTATWAFGAKLNLTPIFLGTSISLYRSLNIGFGIWKKLSTSQKLWAPSGCSLSCVNISPLKNILRLVQEVEFFPRKIAADNWHLKSLNRWPRYAATQY